MPPGVCWWRRRGIKIMWNIRRIRWSGWRYGILRNRVRRTDKFIFLFSLLISKNLFPDNCICHLQQDALWPVLLFTIPFNFLGVYVSYLLVLKQLDVKNKLADKICVAFSSKNGCNAALESSVSKLFGILLWSRLPSTIAFTCSVPWKRSVWPIGMRR